MRRLASALAAIAIMTASAAAETGYILCDPTGTVNLRKGHSTASETIGYMMCGWDFQYTKTRKDSQGRLWYLTDITVEAGDGWVCGLYVTGGRVSVGKVSATVSANGVACRNGVNGSVRNRVNKGKKVTVYAMSDEWCYTSAGYIMTKYLEVSP